MKLYHGTSSKNLKNILEKGIQPRGRRKGNWKEFPSRKDMVYLTNAYAPFFAIQGVGGREKALIIELDIAGIDEENLYPDEDFIAQAIAHQSGLSIQEVHEEIKANLEDYKHHAMDSLGGLGNCCHMGTVPAKSISRYCMIDCAKRTDLGIIAMDPTISLMNYKFCGSRYRSIISWLFGDRKDFELGIGDNDLYIGMMEEHRPGYREEVEEMFANRDGVEVIRLERIAA